MLRFLWTRRMLAGCVWSLIQRGGFARGEVRLYAVACCVTSRGGAIPQAKEAGIRFVVTVYRENTLAALISAFNRDAKNQFEYRNDARWLKRLNATFGQELVDRINTEEKRCSHTPLLGFPFWGALTPGSYSVLICWGAGVGPGASRRFCVVRLSSRLELPSSPSCP